MTASQAPNTPRTHRLAFALLIGLPAAACDDGKRDAPSAETPAAKSEVAKPEPAKPEPAKPEPAKQVAAPPDEPAPTPAEGDPPVAEAPTPTPPAASPPTEPEPPAEPAKSRFEEHVAEMLRVRKTKVVASPGKVAFAHYKAKRYRQAVPLFGAAAVARPTEYKPAFNMACAAALMGDERTAEIALAEALRRDRVTVTAKARKDSDLDSMRDTEWFDEMLAGNPHGGGVAPDPADDDADGDTVADEEEALEAAFARTWFGKHCPDLDVKTKDRRCWDEFLLGDFEFGRPLAMDTVLDIDVTPPAPGPVPKSRWRRVQEKIDVRKVAKAMGVRGGFGLDPLDCEIPSELVPFDDSCPFYRPGFWWPTDDLVLLVIPHTQRRSPVTPRTMTLARWDGATWKATTIDSILRGHQVGGGSWNLLSGVVLRPDGFEFWTWAAGEDADSDALQLPYLCRIGWHDGDMRRACAANWETQFDQFHRD